MQHIRTLLLVTNSLFGFFFRNGSYRLSLFLVTGLLPISASAQQSFNWNGSRSNNDWDQVDNIIGGDGSVSLRSNWTLGGANSEATIPNAGDIVNFLTTNRNRNIDLNGDRTVQSFTIASTNAYTFDTSAIKGQNTLTISSRTLSSTSATATHQIWSNLGFPSNATIQVEDTLEIHGDVEGTQSLNKTGAGTLNLQGAHDGPINVETGRLEILSLAGAINLETTGTLGANDASSDITVPSVSGRGSIDMDSGTLNANLFPGGDGSIGILSAPNNLTLNGTYSCDINQNESDSIAVTGTLDLSNAVLAIDVADLTGNPLTIATYGSLSANFSNANTFPDTVTLTDTGTSLVIQRTRIYVDADNTGTQDGLSWATAFSSLQDALAIAGDGSEVWVKQGIYYPDEGSSQTNDNRNATFSIEGGVAVLGGFDGTETSADQRNPSSHLTILSGDITQNDVTNSDGITESADEIVGNNAYSVVTIDYGFSEVFTTETRLDGFTITGGLATVEGKTATSRGGGLYVAGAGAGGIPIIENCRIYGNYAYDGGGYFVGDDTFDSEGNFVGDDTFCTFISCDIRGNRADRDGGGGATSYATIRMVNSNISGNIADRSAGGINDDVRSNNVTYINCTIAGNYAGSTFGGYDSPTGSPRVTMRNVVFWNNLDARGFRSMDAFFLGRYTIEHCLIEDADLTGQGTANLDGTLVANDPLFIDPVDVTTMTSPTLAGDYRLRIGSPVLDDGNNSFISESEDLAGGPRIVDSVVDLGAYELDNVAPVLVLGGDNPQTVEVDDSVSYADPAGTTASDDQDGDLTTEIVASGVNMGIPGTYSRTYTVSDLTGNETQVVRTVVLQDTIDPVLTVPNDILDLEIVDPAGNDMVDFGVATATDNASAAPAITNDAPDVFLLGETTITWRAEDNSGNFTEATQLVTIVDTTGPEFGTVVPQTFEANAAGGYTGSLTAPTATDNGDANLATPTLISPPSLFPLGETTVTWTVTDADNNNSTVDQIITVEDNTPPALASLSPITLECNTLGGYSGALTPPSATDIADDNLGTPSTQALIPVGENTITWSLTDASGNTGTSEQTITVEDTTPPVISLNGDAALYIELGEPFSDPGATALDICEGSVSVSVGGDTIDSNTLGRYQITYDAEDSEGNNATQVTRDVIVVTVLASDLICVDNAGDFTITTDVGPIGLSADDIVIWNSPDGPVTDLIWGYNAFTSLQAAVDIAPEYAEIRVGEGTFTEAATIEVTQAVTIKGFGSTRTTLSGNNSHPILESTVDMGRPLALRDLTLTEAAGSVLTIWGASSYALLRDVSISDNTALTSAAIVVNDGVVDVLNSTVSGNTSTGLAGAAQVKGIGFFRVVNSTFSGNTSTSTNPNAAGGIHAESSSNIILVHVTITQNDGPNAFGGIGAEDGANLSTVNSIIAGNTGANADSSDIPPILIPSGGRNIVGELGGATLVGVEDIILSTGTLSVDDVIEPTLADNGGNTFTHAIPTGSPALDRIPASRQQRDFYDIDEDGDTSERISIDQRGELRAVDGFADVGAVEANLPPELISTEAALQSGVPGILLTFRQAVDTETASVSLYNNDGSTLLANVSTTDFTVSGNTVFIPIPDTIPKGSTILIEYSGGVFVSSTGVLAPGASTSDGLSVEVPFSTVYVAEAGGFTPSNPSDGATVTWNNFIFRVTPTETVTGLTFGENAFSSVQDAIDAITPGATIKLAQGSYNEGRTIEISKDLTMVGLPDDFVDFDAFDRYGLFSIIGDANVTFKEIVFFSGDNGDSGGAIRHVSSGELRLLDCEITLSSNALYNGSGTVTLMRSALTRNRDNYAVTNFGTLRVYNSTIGRNEAGGIRNGGTADIRQATIVNNGAIGIRTEFDNTTTIANSVIVDHTSFDISGDFNSLGANFIANAEVGSDLNASDLNYSNTGTTDSGDLFTRPDSSTIFFIADTSPLYNAGDDANIPADIDDADGDGDTSEPSPLAQQTNNDNMRVEEGQVDIGAFELSVEPRIIASDPSDKSTGIDPRAPLAFTFNQPVFPGTGTIEFRDAFTDALLVSYDVNGGEVSFDGSTVEITPDTTLLPDGYNFYLEIDADVILDGTGDDFSGISNDTSGTFEYTTCALNVYLNTPDGWGLPPFSSKDNADIGLEVTWNGGSGNTVTGLSFGFNAFVSIEDAMEAACEGATLNFAPGIWNDLWDPDPVDIVKTVTFSGAGLGQTFIVNNFDGDALNILAPDVVITGITILDDPFSRWIETYYPGETDPAIVGFEADPNRIGISNAVAFLTDTDPRAFDPGAIPQIEENNGVLSFIMRFNTEAGFPVVDYSDNLVDWSLASDPADVNGLTYTRITDGFGPGVDKLIIEVDTSIFPDKTFFIRQELVQP